MAADGEIMQRFTPPAIRVVQYTKEEARKDQGDTIGSEHILLGLIREQEGIAARVLERLGVSLGRARNEIRRQTEGKAQGERGRTRAWSSEARRVLELALDEARELNPKLGLPNFVDTEHILLGLVRGADSTATRVLQALGVDLDRVRVEVVKLLAGAISTPQAELHRRVSRFDLTLVDEVRKRLDASYDEALYGLTEGGGDMLRALAAIERRRKEERGALGVGGPLGQAIKLAMQGKMKAVRVKLGDRTVRQVPVPEGLPPAIAAILWGLMSQLSIEVVEDQPDPSAASRPQARSWETR